jgi:hypothetical protein
MATRKTRRVDGVRAVTNQRRRLTAVLRWENSDRLCRVAVLLGVAGLVVAAVDRTHAATSNITVQVPLWLSVGLVLAYGAGTVPNYGGLAVVALIAALRATAGVKESWVGVLLAAWVLAVPLAFLVRRVRRASRRGDV